MIKGLKIIILICCSIPAFAQPELPQRTITATANPQGIHFGTFCLTGSGGGNIFVDANGNRTNDGDIALLSREPSAHPAIFDIKLCPGRNVNITFGGSFSLASTNGGTLYFEMGPPERVIQITTISDCNFITHLPIGGKLIIPAGSPPPSGVYSGVFDLTFNQD